MTTIAKGAYVLATKYNDGDPGDAWAVGFYIGPTPNDSANRHLVGDVDSDVSYRASGYRRVRAGLRAEVGKWLMENAKALEASPPGTVNLWTMLTDLAFEDGSENETGAAGNEAA